MGSLPLESEVRERLGVVAVFGWLPLREHPEPRALAMLWRDWCCPSSRILGVASCYLEEAEGSIAETCGAPTCA